MLNAMRNVKKHVKTSCKIFHYLLKIMNKYADVMPGSACVLGNDKTKRIYVKVMPEVCQGKLKKLGESIVDVEIDNIATLILGSTLGLRNRLPPGQVCQ